MTSLAASAWTILMPLKGGRRAKSRLGGGTPLAAAIALDSLDAVLGCPRVSRVIVVTADESMAAEAGSAGAHVVAEQHRDAGLVPAIRDGLRAALDHRGPTAVLLGDVPALRPADLAVALVALAEALATHPAAPMAAIADHEGSGTVMLAALAAGLLDPAFGPGSFEQHLLRGAVAVPIDNPRLRRDVDTPGDLVAAVQLGVGRRTAALLRERDVVVPTPGEMITISSRSRQTGAGG